MGSHALFSFPRRNLKSTINLAAASESRGWLFFCDGFGLGTGSGLYVALT